MPPTRLAALGSTLLLAGLAAGVGGCASAGLSQSRLEVSMSRTFSHLWDLQQAEQGHPHPPVAALRSRAACTKGAWSAPQQGAGNDWVCSVTWLVDGPGTPVTALYNLNLRTNGCYTADGDGPTAVNGTRTMTTARGATIVNPLWSFDGCFDPT